MCVNKSKDVKLNQSFIERTSRTFKAMIVQHSTPNLQAGVAWNYHNPPRSS